MLVHMLFEVTSCCAQVIALSATEWLFPRMGQHVSLEVSSLIGRIFTLHTVERLPTTLKQHSRFQIICQFDWVVHFMFQTLLELFSHFDLLQFNYQFLRYVADGLSCSALC